MPDNNLFLFDKYIFIKCKGLMIFVEQDLTFNDIGLFPVINPIHLFVSLYALKYNRYSLSFFIKTLLYKPSDQKEP